jgi:hypothetical protein
MARTHVVADQHVRHGGDGLAIYTDDIVADQVRGFEFASRHDVGRARQDRFSQCRIFDGSVRRHWAGIRRFSLGRTVRVSYFNEGDGTGACSQGGHQGSGGNEVFHRMFLSLREHPLDARGARKVPESACNFEHEQSRGAWHAQHFQKKQWVAVSGPCQGVADGFAGSAGFDHARELVLERRHAAAHIFQLGRAKVLDDILDGCI